MRAAIVKSGEAESRAAPLAVLRGGNDLASAVALKLAQAGLAVLMLESAAPVVTRRGQAFADAVFDGRASLAGVEARLVDDLASWAAQGSPGIAVATRELPEVLELLKPAVLIDARMRKRSVAEDQRGLAPLVIGLGPGFTAGGNVDAAVETAWGEDLGKPLFSGSTRELAGEPHPVGGYRRERYVYAPSAGVFHTQKSIGDPVQAGELVARIGDEGIAAPISGLVRGLVHDGVVVAQKAKVVEVVPAGSQVYGLSERPERAAQGVMAVLRARSIVED